MFSTAAFQVKPTLPLVVVRVQTMTDELGRAEWFWYCVDARGIEFGDRGFDKTEVLTSFAATTGLRLRDNDLPMFLDRRTQRAVLAGMN